VRTLQHALEEHAIEAVLHFAAYSYVGESMSDPAKYYRNNLGGSLNLLDALVAAGRAPSLQPRPRPGLVGAGGDQHRPPDLRPQPGGRNGRPPRRRSAGEVASSDKASQELGWTPHYADLATIIGHAWAWHQRRFGKGADVNSKG
jgi:UDP-glucose 4-epimerase